MQVRETNVNVLSDICAKCRACARISLTNLQKGCKSFTFVNFLIKLKKVPLTLPPAPY